MYVPQNLTIFTAAFAGALAGMGSSGRVITDPIPADYSSYTDAAGAFAQAIDTTWGVTPATELDVQAMEECCESSFQGRSPPVGAPFNLASNYTGLAAAIVALVQEGDAYYASQGIVSPVVDGSAAFQLVWYVDEINGNDSNNGATPATAKKTPGAVTFALRTMQTGVNYQMFLLSDISTANAVFKPSFVSLPNEDAVQANGVRQVFNITMSGSLTPIAGAVTTIAAWAATGANQAQATFADAAVVTANVDQMFQITASADAGNVGATFGLAIDLGAGVARVTDMAAAPGKTLNAAAFVGSTVSAVQLSKWNGDLIQMGNSQGRFQINYLEFPAVPAPPADQKNLVFRTGNGTFFGCRFLRPLQFDVGSAATINACLVIGNGGTFTKWLQFNAATAYVNTLFKNLELNFLRTITVDVNGVYLENSTIVSGLTYNTGTYGAAAGLAPNFSANSFFSIVGNGLSCYNYPLTSPGGAAVCIKDKSKVKVGALIRGGYDGPVPAGAVAVLVDGSDLEFGVGAPLPTIVGDNAGTGADIRITNPLGTVDLACRALQGGAMAIAAAGAVTTDAQLLKTWAVWAGVGATDFQKYAFNPHNGGRVWQGVV